MSLAAPERFQGLDRFEARRRVVRGVRGSRAAGEGRAPPPRGGALLPLRHRGRAAALRPVVRADGAARPARARGVPRRDASGSSPSAGATTTPSWLEGIRDWCISRQLWWGHRIPVWYCEDEGCGRTTREPDRSRPRAPTAAAPVRQDEDVLDTWFSSWLWPFSTLGWPDQHAGPRDVLSRPHAGHRARRSCSSGSRG